MASITEKGVDSQLSGVSVTESELKQDCCLFFQANKLDEKMSKRQIKRLKKKEKWLSLLPEKR